MYLTDRQPGLLLSQTKSLTVEMVIAFEKKEQHKVLLCKIVIGNLIKLSQRPPQQLVTREEEW